MNFGAVVLAAGFSSRMGNFKPLMQLNGKSMLTHCVSLFHDAGVERVVVVTGHRCEEVMPPVEELGALSVYNSDYAEGMFGSICSALPHFAGVDGFFILPVDIPLIRRATLDLLVSRFNGDSVVYPRFADERGHPPLIPASFISAILEHDGFGGLQTLLETLPGTDVPVWDKGILMDADTPADYDALIQRVATMETGTATEAEALAELMMPQRGVAHGRAVAGIASLLGEELNRHGYSLDLNILYNGALLHDIAKGLPDHERAGAEMLKSLGLGSLAESVGLHRDAHVPGSGEITETELVCLADKLVRGTRRMSIEERFTEKLQLYSDDRVACAAIRERLANALALKQLVENSTGRSVEEILGDLSL
jgi:CTP:molybdopterin cytidylyltransferase MocA